MDVPEAGPTTQPVTLSWDWDDKTLEITEGTSVDVPAVTATTEDGNPVEGLTYKYDYTGNVTYADGKITAGAYSAENNTSTLTVNFAGDDQYEAASLTKNFIITEKTAETLVTPQVTVSSDLGESDDVWFYFNNAKISATNDGGGKIYYTVNGGEPVEYTDGITLKLSMAATTATVKAETYNYSFYTTDGTNESSHVAVTVKSVLPKILPASDGTYSYKYGSKIVIVPDYNDIANSPVPNMDNVICYYHNDTADPEWEDDATEVARGESPVNVDGKDLPCYEFVNTTTEDKIDQTISAWFYENSNSGPSDVKTVSLLALTAPAAPVIEAAENFVQGNEVTIIAPEGDLPVEVRYTLDGTVPTATEGVLYDAPFALNDLGEVTVKAIAYYPSNDTKVSEVAVKTIKVEENLEVSGTAEIVFNISARNTGFYSKEEFEASAYQSGKELVSSEDFVNGQVGISPNGLYLSANNAKSTLTLNLVDPVKPTKLEVKVVKVGTYADKIIINGEEYTLSNGEQTFVLTPSAQISSIIIENPNVAFSTNGRIAIKSISWEYSVVKAGIPTITVAENGEVAITPGKNAAKTWYSTDGGEVYNEYNDPFIPSASCTISAYSETAEGVKGNVATLDYTSTRAIADVVLVVGNADETADKFAANDKFTVRLCNEGETTTSTLDLGDLSVKVTGEYAGTLGLNNKVDGEPNAYELAITDAGTYEVTIFWAGTDAYQSGSATASVSIYEPFVLDVKENATATVFGNGETGLLVTSGTIILKLEDPSTVYYKAEEHVNNTPSTPEETPEETAYALDSSFRNAYEGYVYLEGNAGWLTFVTEKNGVVSPETKYAYATDEKLLNFLVTSVDSIFSEDGESVYFDLNGNRVNAENLERGIYVRVSGGKAVKVVK